MACCGIKDAEKGLAVTDSAQRYRLLVCCAVSSLALVGACKGGVSAPESPPPERSAASLAAPPQQPTAPAGDDDRVAAAPPVAPESVLPELDPEKATATAPDRFNVLLNTSKGEIRIHVVRAWSPHGADRFYNLVRMGFYDDAVFFRVIAGFMAQVGMHGNPIVNRRFQGATIADDPVRESNQPGFVTFAKTGAPNSRTTQFFINTGDNKDLDGMGFSPIGKTDDLDVVRALYSEFGDGPPGGRGPLQGRIAMEGNEYLRREFPQLDIIRSAVVVE